MCSSVRSVCPRVVIAQLVGSSTGDLKDDGWRSTWRAKRPLASPFSCGWGFPVRRPLRHWGATVGWGPSLPLWLSPPGTCRTLEALYHRGKTKRRYVKLVWLKYSCKITEKEIYVVVPSLVTPSSPSSPFCLKAKKTMSHLGVDSTRLNPQQTTTHYYEEQL